MYRSEICAMLRTKGSTTYAKAHTCKKKAASWMNTMSSSKINRKAKTCNEIGMLQSVWNVTEVLCFPFRSRNVNVCRVSDSRACNIYLPMWEAGITVLSCRSQNISQKGQNRLKGRRRYINTGASDTDTHVTHRVGSTVLSSLHRNISLQRRERLRRWKHVLLSVDRKRKKDGRRLERFYAIICINAM